MPHAASLRPNVTACVSCASVTATGRSRPCASLDAPSGQEEGETMAAQLGTEDKGLADAERRASLSPLLARLPEREQTILHLRFFEGLTQSDIAARLGISQMHVSRLLARSLAELRSAAEE